MRSRIIWLLTALVVAGICIRPVWQGSELISYAMAGNEPEDVRPWVSVSGLSFRAREYALTSTDDSSEDATIHKRRDELMDMLAIRPLSSFYWLQLAESRVDADEAPTKVSAAFELSKLTGSNEGYMITQRGMFGVWQWEALSPENQNGAITDLVTRRLSNQNLTWLKTTLSKKTEQTRQSIRLALQAQGLSESDFARIGL